MVCFPETLGLTTKLIQVLGTLRDKTALFKSIRQQTVDKDLLEVSRLEKRLTRLTQLLASLPPDQVQPSATKLFSIGWQSDQRKSLEQTVVSWQDDASVSRCPFCQQDFSGYSFRRHHCRTCGRVVCGDAGTGCSSEVGLSIAPSKFPQLHVRGQLYLTFSIVSKSSEKVAANNLLNIDVRLCKDCKSTLFDRRDFEADITQKPLEVRSYDNLIQFERGIRLHMPKFQKLLSALQYVYNTILTDTLLTILKRSKTPTLVSSNSRRFQSTQATYGLFRKI
jgi:hypothetical protein